MSMQVYLLWYLHGHSEYGQQKSRHFKNTSFLRAFWTWTVHIPKSVQARCQVGRVNEKTLVCEKLKWPASLQLSRLLTSISLHCLPSLAPHAHCFLDPFLSCKVRLESYIKSLTAHQAFSSGDWPLLSFCWWFLSKHFVTQRIIWRYYHTP